MTSSVSIAQTVREFVAREKDSQIAFLAEIVRVPSDNPPGDCAALARRSEALLKALGLTVEADVVDATAVAAVGMISATNLIIRRHFGTGGPTIALNAHGDVVPPGLGWKHDPYGAEIVDDGAGHKTMYGRGVAVSKSDFATYTWALLALVELETHGVALNGSIELHFTFDEESGGEIGPERILDTGLSHPDLALSAGFSYAITTAHNGCLHLEVVVHGRQAHAAMPHTGHDALEASTGILQALYAFRETLALGRSAITGIDAPTLNIGLIRGGINTNVVPDRIEFRIDRRVIPEERIDDAQAELEALIQATADGMPGIHVETRRILLAQPLEELPGYERLAEPLRRYASEEFATEVNQHGVPLYTDARHYAAKGIPTVLYGAGPRTLLEANGHAANEKLQLDDLTRATVVVTRTLAELLGARDVVS